MCRSQSNTAVQSALRNTSAISKRVAASRSLVEHLKKSELACNKLKDEQQQMGQHTTLVQDVSARWNNTFHMLSRQLEQSWPVTAALTDLVLNASKTFFIVDFRRSKRMEHTPLPIQRGGRPGGQYQVPGHPHYISPYLVHTYKNK